MTVTAPTCCWRRPVVGYIPADFQVSEHRNALIHFKHGNSEQTGLRHAANASNSDEGPPDLKLFAVSFDCTSSGEASLSCQHCAALSGFLIWSYFSSSTSTIRYNVPCQATVTSNPRGVPHILPHITITRTYTLGNEKRPHLRKVLRKFTTADEAADNPFQTNPSSSCSPRRSYTIDSKN